MNPSLCSHRWELSFFSHISCQSTDSAGSSDSVHSFCIFENLLQDSCKNNIFQFKFIISFPLESDAA